MNKMRNNHHNLILEKDDEEFIEKIKGMRLVPSSSFQHRLLNEVLQENASKNGRAGQRRLKANRFVVVFLLILIVIAVPPTRSWAADSFDELLVRLNIKREVNEVVPVISSRGNTIHYLDRDSIQSQVDFQVYHPHYLPENYHDLGFYHVNDTVYWKAVMLSIDTDSKDEDMLLLQQSPSTDGALRIGSASVKIFTVHQQPALWIQGVLNTSISVLQNGDNNAQTESTTNSFLVWEENNITYILQSKKISVEEMLSIADSIHR